MIGGRQGLGEAGVQVLSFADPEVTIKEVAASLKVNRATIYRALGLGAGTGRAGKPQVGQENPFKTKDLPYLSYLPYLFRDCGD
jgi:hypothetical protein